MNSAHMNPTYQRAKRHAARLLQDAEEDEQYEQAGRRARARRNRRRGRDLAANDICVYPALYRKA